MMRPEAGEMSYPDFKGNVVDESQCKEAEGV